MCAIFIATAIAILSAEVFQGAFQRDYSRLISKACPTFYTHKGPVIVHGEVIYILQTFVT